MESWRKVGKKELDWDEKEFDESSREVAEDEEEEEEEEEESHALVSALMILRDVGGRRFSVNPFS